MPSSFSQWLWIIGERECAIGWPIRQARRKSGVISERRERGGLEDAALLALVRAELAALREVGLERRIGHQRIALFLALGLALVLPYMHHLVQRPDLGRGVEHRLAAVLHLRRMAVLFIELQPRGELVVVQRVDAQVENHAASSGRSV